MFVAIRGTLGGIELMLPDLPTRWLLRGSRPDRRAIVTVRILGARQVVQALLLYVAPGARIAAAGVVVDGTHAVSMLALAVLSPRWRRPALAEAVMAAALASVGVAVARSLPGRCPDDPTG